MDESDFVFRKYQLLEWAFKSELTPCERLEKGLDPNAYAHSPAVLCVQVAPESDSAWGTVVTNFTAISGDVVATLALDVATHGHNVAWRDLDIEARLENQSGKKRCNIVLPSGNIVSRKDWDRPAVELLDLVRSDSPKVA